VERDSERNWLDTLEKKFLEFKTKEESGDDTWLAEEENPKVKKRLAELLTKKGRRLVKDGRSLRRRRLRRKDPPSQHAPSGKGGEGRKSWHKAIRRNNRVRLHKERNEKGGEGGGWGGGV